MSFSNLFKSFLVCFCSNETFSPIIFLRFLLMICVLCKPTPYNSNVNIICIFSSVFIHL